jgi:hypothetical protein
MPIPLQDPEVFDVAVKACLEPDPERLAELVEKLERYLERNGRRSGPLCKIDQTQLPLSSDPDP